MPKLLIGLMSTLSVILMLQAKAAPALKEPYLVNVAGQVTWQGEKEKTAPAKINAELRGRARLTTGPGSWARVALTKDEQLVVAPESQVLIPLISWEDGSIERIELEKGRMRLMNLTSKPRVVLTEVSRDAYAEADIVFDYNPTTKKLKASVMEGRASFRGLENEESRDLQRNEEASFQGLIEDGQLAVDILLQGRRVARGTLSPETSVDPKVRADWDGAFSRMEKQRKEEAKKAAQKARKMKGAICDKPDAKYNQCAWICENNPRNEKTKCRLEKSDVRCVRLRCDAGGRWSDRTELLPAQASCAARAHVGPCDY